MPVAEHLPEHQPGPDVFAVMRDLGHGRVEDLRVSGGKPQVTSKTKLLRRFRPDRPAEPPPARPLPPTCRPHPQHQKLLAHCQALADGVIARVEVADGLPVHWSDT